MDRLTVNNVDLLNGSEGKFLISHADVEVDLSGSCPVLPLRELRTVGFDVATLSRPPNYHYLQTWSCLL